MSDMAQAIDAVAALLRAIPGARVYDYLADNMRPPAYVLAQPSWSFTGIAPCWAQAELVIYAVQTRQHDRQPQRELLDMVEAAVEALAGQNNLSIRPLRSQPQNITQGEQTFPGYSLTVELVL